MNVSDQSRKSIAPASGPVMSSLVWVWATTVFSGLALWVVIEYLILGGRVSAAPLIGIAAGLSLMVPVLRRMSTVAVDEMGFEVRSGPYIIVINWDDIVDVDAGRFSGKVTLRAPIRVGPASRRSVAFAALDPKWRTRPVSAAILEAQAA